MVARQTRSTLLVGPPIESRDSSRVLVGHDLHPAPVRERSSRASLVTDSNSTSNGSEANDIYPSSRFGARRNACSRIFALGVRALGEISRSVVPVCQRTVGRHSSRQTSRRQVSDSAVILSAELQAQRSSDQHTTKGALAVPSYWRPCRCDNERP